MTREDLIKSIHKYLEAYTGSIQSDASKNLLSSSVLAEGFVAWLLNTLHRDWNLINTNQGRSNFPAIDLIDEDSKIAVQVSCSNTPKKVRRTQEQFDSADIPHKDQYTLYIVTLTMDRPTDTMLACAKDYPGTAYVWSFDDLYEQITQISELSTLETIYASLKKEIAVDPVEIPTFSLTPSSRVGDGFVGRRSHLLEIQNKLTGGMKPVVLSGLGGIGKTELAIHFGHGYRANCRGHVFFVTYSGSFRDTLISMYSHLRDKPDTAQPTPEKMLETVLNALRGCRKSDILIVDNVDADQGVLGDLMDEAYDLLEEMDISLILTTRFEWEDAVDVDILEQEELYQIFRKYAPALAKADMDALIRAVDSHTLTIDLMARMLNGKGVRSVTPAALLETFRNNAVREEKYRRIASHYKQSPKQAHIYEHLSAVFNVAELSDEAKNVLRCATLLPTGGMYSELFADSLPAGWENALEELAEHGWLNTEDGVITIHPVIRLVCRTELEPSDENCGVFLNALWNQIGRDEYARGKFAQLAELFANAADTLADPEAEWLNSSGRLWNDLMQSRKAQELYEKHIPALEKRLPDSLPLATAYNNISAAYGDWGDHEKGLEYDLKAVAILEKVLPPEHPDLAASYNNVGCTYDNLGDPKKALEYMLKALAIQEKVLPREHPQLALSYDNMGNPYRTLGNHQKALEYGLKALMIQEKVLPPDHPSLATSYNNVSCTYCELGDAAKDLEYGLKALTIREKVLPPEHPSLATAYNNVGITYANLEQYATAMKYLEKALAIREKSLPAGHPHTESTRRSIEVVRTWL